MDKILKRIYEEVIYYEQEAVEADSRINKEIIGISSKYADKLTKPESEELRSLLYRISLTAQEKGFLLGMRYMWRLFKLLEKD